jgi:hypothetical protein
MFYNVPMFREQNPDRPRLLLYHYVPENRNEHSVLNIVPSSLDFKLSALQSFLLSASSSGNRKLVVPKF